MTELTAVGTRGFNTEHFQKYSSIGLLAPNMQAKVMDWITGCSLPPGCSGELWIRGPAVMKGANFGSFLELFSVCLPGNTYVHLRRSLNWLMYFFTHTGLQFGLSPYKHIWFPSSVSHPTISY